MYGIIYLNRSYQSLDLIWNTFSQQKSAIAVIEGLNRKRDLAPWAAPCVFKTGEDFGGYFNDIPNRIAKGLKFISE